MCERECRGYFEIETHKCVTRKASQEYVWYPEKFYFTKTYLKLNKINNLWTLESFSYATLNNKLHFTWKMPN